MRLDPAEARLRLRGARVARLATVSGGGQPHVVPITFALDETVLYFAIDHKPKMSSNLRRLGNIRENDRVSVVADHYDENWSALWWVRADGRAQLWEDDRRRATPLDLLIEKYPQYREQTPAGPVVAIAIHSLTGWSFSD
ncbi:TIGR03668 family PPOX class F420-dependent oxidoreductase [Streptomyces sp. SID3343]|uniref:TIGR03668 family PPOX class F420-dependent oxidoreductase n=1 Tax=Streptomyces sp. SID3343 TaxID=2690260 RepID=UPI001370C9D6|nr:TIGR03668 family PPOX class F420-dependent oxidoreductase [Streptomyces sp. SID3343]MYW01545.1 TIGR03668 family PPOX class F420-dependent oxidoreductase [Streptomyces sp. SID3343]